MSGQHGAPALIVPKVSYQALKRLPRKHDRFDETYLQTLLRDHPDILPVEDVRIDAGRLLCMGREVGVSSGSIDNLYLSTNGYPVIVETKLWRNPESRREVLAQVLDYIKDVVKKDFDWFENQWAAYRKPDAGSLVSALNDLVEEEIDESILIERVNRALGRGDVIAMIVGDGIDARLQGLVDHLRADSPLLRYSLALVELACFAPNEGSDKQILIVPRVVKSVEPVQRAYIHLDIADRLKGQLAIESSVEVEPESGRTTRVTLDEEEFLSSVESSAGIKCRIAIQEFYQDLISAFGLEPEFKAAAVMLKVPDPEGERPGVSVLALEKAGRIYNTEFLPQQLSRWGIDKSVAKGVAEEFWAALHALDARFDRTGMSHLKSGQFLPFLDLVPRLPAIKEETGKVVAAIRQKADDVRRDPSGQEERQ